MYSASRGFASRCIPPPFIRSGSALEGSGVSGIDVQDVTCRLGGALGGEEGDGFGDVLRIHAALEEAALAVHRLQPLRRRPVLPGPLLGPFALPDARAAQHRIRIDDIDTD